MIIIVLALGGSLRAQDAALEGQRVLAVRVVEESGREFTGRVPAVPLKPGEPFHIEAERKSLQELYRTGLFADIRTEATSVPGGLRVDFVVHRNYYNNVVRVFGLKEPPNEAAAIAALNLPLGQPFTQSALQEGLKRLGETLHSEGLYQAHWDYQLVAHEDTRQMDVLVRVTPGPRARIGSVVVQNQSPYSDKELQKRAKLHPKQDVTAQRLGRAAERLRKYLVAAGYLGARVLVRRGDYDMKTNRLPIILDVAAGPRVRLEVVGAHFSGKELRKLLPIYAEGSADEDLLEEGRRNLRDHLEGDGFFDAKVNYTTRQDTEHSEEVIQYQVERGQRHRLVGVAFDGNNYFDTEQFESRLTIQVASFLSRGRFSDRLVRADASSIQALYLSNGFLEAKVRTEVDDNYRDRKGDVFVRFHITEGPQTRVAELKLEGNHALSDRELLSVIGSTPGQPYSDANITSDRDNILALYFDQGFPDASFDAETIPLALDRVRLIYHIKEGQRVDVCQVFLSGYQHTRRGVIARQVTVKPEEPLRESDVIETQQRLYNLGIFDRAAVAPQNPDGTDPDKNVVVDVEEGKRYTIGYGFGFEAQRIGSSSTNPTSTAISASPRGIFEITKLNVGGRAQTLSFKARASTLQYRGLLSFTAPNLLTKSWLNLILTGFADKTQDVNTFTSTRYETSVQFVQALSPGSTLLYRYFFRHVLVDASTLRIAPEQIPLLSQPTKISGFGVTWVRDRRDNPADATRGSFNTADFSLAARSLGSSASFARFFFQNSSFYPLGRTFVFARSTRFGVEQTLNGTTAVEIPLPERLFAGGGTSLRGFGLNQAGPRDPVTGFPIGGLALLVFNQELGFPMHLPWVGSHLGGAIFYDAGNVFSSVGHLTLRTAPSAVSVNTGDLNYFSHTVGFGFRYKTPIGPVRLDLGYQLNPAHFLLTNTTTNTAQLSQLPHFQFFFNIGSIF